MDFFHLAGIISVNGRGSVTVDVIKARAVKLYSILRLLSPLWPLELLRIR
jgi:hypothetical protein